VFKRVQIITDPTIYGLRIGASPSLKEAILQPLRTNENDSAPNESTTVRLSPSVASKPAAIVSHFHFSDLLSSVFINCNQVNVFFEFIKPVKLF